jgi:hypothetical protein
MARVSFINDSPGYTQIWVGSKRVGSISGTTMCYVHLYDTRIQGPVTPYSSTPVARFKYRSPKTMAKEFCKVVLNKLTPEQVIDAVKLISPLELKVGIETGNFQPKWIG